MAKEIAILDFSNARTKQMVLAHIKRADGLHWFEFRRCRDQRTLKQNAWYWAVAIKHVQAAIEEAWGERLSSDEIHVLLRGMFLKRPIVNQSTGEVKGETILSTTALDTAEFSAYLERVIAWLADNFGITINEKEMSNV